MLRDFGPFERGNGCSVTTTCGLTITCGAACGLLLICGATCFLDGITLAAGGRIAVLGAADLGFATPVVVVGKGVDVGGRAGVAGRVVREDPAIGWGGTLAGADSWRSRSVSLSNAAKASR